MTGVLGSAGCDRGSPTSVDSVGPPVRVVWTYPPHEAHDVPVTFSISVQFDRFLLPSTTLRQTICLQAATVGAEHPGLDFCEGAGLAPHYDPVDRIATWTIRGKIFPKTRYNVRIFAPNDANDTAGVRAFDGAPLEKEYIFAFTTGDQSPGLEPSRKLGFCAMKSLCPLPDGACDGPAPTPLTASPHDFLAASCTRSGNCHGAAGQGSGLSGSALQFQETPGGSITPSLRRLVLDSVVATETATGVDPTAPSRSVLTPFGRNMPYIDAANPANSYLLYKLILGMAPRCPFDGNEESAMFEPTACAPDGGYARGTYERDWFACDEVARKSLPRDEAGVCPSDGGFAPLHVEGARGRPLAPPIPPRIPDDAWRPPASGEYERLRTRIRGLGMPHGGMVSRAEALTISAWIASGAEVEDCP
jgi:hypothetical protein